MFRRLPEPESPSIEVIVDGRPVLGKSGDTVAAVLMAAGEPACRRSAVSGEPRGPYCLMGVCFECLVDIDGVANRQACLVPIRSGMRVETGAGKRKIAL
jgi:predicted molibdopterin-dependent oxidoreductase YjgC